jgi:signal peptidase I
VMTSCTKRKMVQKSSTMEPTIRSGETIDVDLVAFTMKGPSRWEAIVFEAPSGGGQWCSRVVGLPGETIDITSTGLTLDGRTISGPSGFSLPSYRPVVQSPPSAPIVPLPFRVPAGSYFVIGDNVSNSLGSRYWGGLDESKIIGRTDLHLGRLCT